jgi:hypothetical protein
LYLWTHKQREEKNTVAHVKALFMAILSTCTIPLSPVSNDPLLEEGTLNQPRIIDAKNTEPGLCYV